MTFDINTILAKPSIEWSKEELLFAYSIHSATDCEIRDYDKMWRRSLVGSNENSYALKKLRELDGYYDMLYKRILETDWKLREEAGISNEYYTEEQWELLNEYHKYKKLCDDAKERFDNYHINGGLTKAEEELRDVDYIKDLEAKRQEELDDRFLKRCKQVSIDDFFEQPTIDDFLPPYSVRKDS